MKILVTGGAGFIGSHTVRELLKKGHEIVVYDNLIYGHKKALPSNCPLIKGDLANITLLEKTFAQESFEAVMHFACFIAMGESMENPSKYFNNNIIGGLHLFDTMVKFKVKKIIFSSTAGIYGNPIRIPILEDDPQEPTNPYGETKLMLEKILKWYDQVYGLKSISLRYFNACGASLDGTLGEDHDPETHIIPQALQTVLGKEEKFILYGDDYPTADGTCIRDYIHVLDLVEAHILALKVLKEDLPSNYYNVGTGKGYSNKEIIEMVKKVTGRDFKVEIGLRRPGDATELVASPEKIKKELGWKPKYSDLETIVKTAWDWYRNHPEGYSS